MGNWGYGPPTCNWWPPILQLQVLTQLGEPDSTLAEVLNDCKIHGPKLAEILVWWQPEIPRPTTVWIPCEKHAKTLETQMGVPQLVWLPDFWLPSTGIGLIYIPPNKPRMLCLFRWSTTKIYRPGCEVRQRGRFAIFSLGMMWQRWTMNHEILVVFFWILTVGSLHSL